MRERERGGEAERVRKQTQNERGRVRGHMDVLDQGRQYGEDLGIRPAPPEQ